MPSGELIFSKCSNTLPVLEMVLQATCVTDLARLLRLSLQWKQRVHIFLASTSRCVDITSDAIARRRSEEAVGFLTRHCSQLRCVRLGSVHASALLQLPGCTEHLVLLDLDFYVGGFHLPHADYFETWANWVATGWHRLQVLQLHDSANLIEGSPAKLAAQAGFGDVLDMVGLHCLHLVYLSVRAPFDDDREPAPGLPQTCVRFLEAALQFHSLAYLDLDLPFLDADLSEAGANVSAPICMLRLVADGCGLYDQLCDFLCRILPQTSQLVILTVDGTDGAETANVMDTLGQNCQQLRCLSLDGCEGIPAVLARLTDQPEWCSQLRALEVRPGEAGDNTPMCDQVDALRQARPELSVYPHAEEDIHSAVLQKCVDAVRLEFFRMVAGPHILD